MGNPSADSRVDAIYSSSVTEPSINFITEVGQQLVRLLTTSCPASIVTA